VTKRNVLLHRLGWLIAAMGSCYVLVATLFPSLSGAIFLFSPDHSAADVGQAGMDMILALSAVFGATMIGWGITIVYLADHFSRGARRFLTLGVLAWYVTDSAGSLWNHLGHNAILNTVFLLLALTALFARELDDTAAPM